jgi:ABC-type uncharacterized transport system auxiliary subunit
MLVNARTRARLDQDSLFSGCVAETRVVQKSKGSTFVYTPVRKRERETACRWAADPRLLVTNAVVDHLRASGHFSSVSTYDGHGDMDYIFSGKLEKLEEVDSDEGVKVEVAMSAQITRARTGAMVWSNAVSEVAAVPRHNVPGVVSHMNRTMDVAINKLLSTVPDRPSNN